MYINIVHNLIWVSMILGFLVPGAIWLARDRRVNADNELRSTVTGAIWVALVVFSYAMIWLYGYLTNSYLYPFSLMILVPATALGWYSATLVK
ncbi:hypothetical protein CR956_01645 [Candidatus Saccharibacteria bacterium]|nr:MAG: hypothetical protein CR956_01645 [Candidatus Saccharibacteria bacterium]